MAKRPRYTDTPAPQQPESVSAPSQSAEAPAKRPGVRADYKGMTIYLPPETHRALKILAMDQETTIAGLIYKGVNKVLVENGQQPIQSERLHIAR